MPLGGGRFEDFEECLRVMQEEEGHDEEAARSICGALESEEKSEHGDPEALLDAIDRGAGLIADVGVDLVSGVDVPAIDSKWVMLKSESDDHDYRVNSPILLAKDEDETAEQRISYAAAMIPRELDKEGDVAPTATVEKAAHDFLTQSGGVDTDHSLIDGEGDVVESWVLKDERAFDLPGGSEESYPPGTWMVGIKWGAEPWQRIKDGELTGLSIYGMAEHVALKEASRCVDCQEELSGTKYQDGDTLNSETAKSGVIARMSSEDIDPEDFADSVATAVSEKVESPDVDVDVPEPEAYADAVAEKLAEKDDDADGDDGEAEKDVPENALSVDRSVNPSTLVDLMGEMENIEASADEIASSVEPLFNAKEEDEDEEDDEEEEEKSTDDVEKRASDANLAKGSDGEATREARLEAKESEGAAGLPSYRAAAEEEGL